jgi:hypothetical protein
MRMGNILVLDFLKELCQETCDRDRWPLASGVNDTSAHWLMVSMLPPLIIDAADQGGPTVHLRGLGTL